MDWSRGIMKIDKVAESGYYTFEIRGKKNGYFERASGYISKDEPYFWKFRKSGVVSDVYNWKLYNYNKSYTGSFGLCLDK